MPDVLVRAIDRAAGLRVVAAVTTDLVREAARRHQTGGISACALGRALTSSVLVATLTKSGERVTLQIEADGPIKSIVVDASIDGALEGQVRGYLSRPRAALSGCTGRCRVVEALGKSGVVNVMRDLGLNDRYQGQVPILTGEIDEDVEHYLRTSEQVPSALGCDVVLDGELVIASAGVLVQALPGAEEDPVRPAQQRIRGGAVYEYIARGGPVSAHGLAEAVYGGPLEFLSEQPLLFRCRCSAERVESMLSLLTTVDIDEMIADPGHAEVTCNFCSTNYIVDRPALERVRQLLAHGPRERN